MYHMALLRLNRSFFYGRTFAYPRMRPNAQAHTRTHVRTNTHTHKTHTSSFLFRPKQLFFHRSETFMTCMSSSACGWRGPVNQTQYASLETN